MIDQIKALLGAEHVLEQEPMSRHTTFRIGGPVRAMLLPQSASQLVQLVQLLSEHREPFLIFGNGSNLLVPDEGIDRYIIKIEQAISRYRIDGSQVIAEAGVLLSELAQAAMEAELTGFEFASGIPGTLGGAVYMNAGAYGGEMKDVVRWVEVIDEHGDNLIVDRSAMDFGYRMSAVRNRGWIVLRVCLDLSQGKYDEIKARTDDLTEQRVSKQPLELPSAGSVFKRPPGHFAGKLIQDAGLRGAKIGGAQISEKHCGFIVNVDGATCCDVLNLVEYVRQEVASQFGVELEREIRIFGQE
ncbi:MAG: UDP-N-acetylmuramate dehydrogenase [Bacillota bacterium]|nr:UDP-N-acetylmuramate dehydrogenase [Bacillota bacterium]